MAAAQIRHGSPFGELLSHLRTRTGLTQESLAERARLSPRAISDLERGVRRFPRRETLDLLARALNLTPDERSSLIAAAARPSRAIRKTGSPGPAFARLSRFIGREHELSRLMERLTAVGQGKGGVVLINGEPGIGKTRLVAEFADRAAERGWLTLSGRAYDAEIMPPYLPFAEALRGYLHHYIDDNAVLRFAADAPEIASLLPELRERLPERSTSVSLGPEADRYRLFEAVSNVFETLSRAAGREGLLLCLDDLHWADASTLLLLEHVVRRLAGVRFLLVATYRDFEVKVTNALAECLEHLLRDRLSQSIDLPRLTRDETGLMLSALGRADPPGDLISEVFDETEGNPLFVEEVFLYLGQRGLLFDTAGEWSRDLALRDREVPQGIRLLIQHRLSQASEGCRRVLTTAAVIGRSFDHELLGKLSGLEEEAFYDALEEAQQMHVLAPTSSEMEVTFTHELIRQTLLGDLSLPRRQRLHERIVQAMEDLFEGNLEPHLATLATHSRLANTPPALRKAIDYGIRAAEQAASAYAYREAARLYEQVLEALDLLEPGNQGMRADLLLALGRVLLPDGDLRRVLDSVALQALRISQSMADDNRARFSCRLAMEALCRRGMRMITLTDEWHRWASWYDEYAGQETVDRIRLEIDSAEYLHMTGREAEARERRLAALDLARRLGSRDELLYAASFCMYYTQAPGFQRQRFELAHEAFDWPIDGVGGRTLAHFCLYLGWVFWDWGERAKAEEAWRRLRELPEQVPDNFATLFGLFADACRAGIEGRLEEAVDLAFSGIERGVALGSPAVGRQSASFAAYRPLLYLDRADEILALLPILLEEADAIQEPAVVRPRRLLVLAHLGRRDEADALLTQIMAERQIGSEDSGNEAMVELLPLLEASVLLRRRDVARTVSSRLKSVSGLIEAHGGSQTSVGRHLGDAAVLLGNPTEAREYYNQALQVCERIGFRPEAALIHLSLGKLLLQHYPKESRAAAAHLDGAIDEFEAMNMRPALHQARQLRGPGAPLARRLRPAGLSRREMEVLGLLASGKSNKAIAEELVLSEKTVEKHLTSIYGKLGTDNRAAAVAFAIRHGVA